MLFSESKRRILQSQLFQLIDQFCFKQITFQCFLFNPIYVATAWTWTLHLLLSVQARKFGSLIFTMEPRKPPKPILCLFLTQLLPNFTLLYLFNGISSIFLLRKSWKRKLKNFGIWWSSKFNLVDRSYLAWFSILFLHFLLLSFSVY